MSGLLLAWSSVWNTVLLFPDCFWSSEWCVWFSAGSFCSLYMFLKLDYFTMWPPWGENQISPVQPRSSSTRTGSKFKSVAAGRINFIVRPVLQESSTCFGLGRPAKQWFIALHVFILCWIQRLLLCEKHFLFVDLLQATYSQFSQRNYFQLLSSSQAVPLERPNVIISATFQHPWPRTKTSSSEVWIQCSLVLCANVRATIKVLFEQSV